MTDWIPQLITVLPDGGGYLLLIAMVALFESLPLLGLAMPGSTLIVFTGFLAAHGKGDLLLVILVSAFGAFGGDLVSYLLGKQLGKKILTTTPMQRRQPQMNAARKFLLAHGGKSLLYARFLGPIRGTVPFLAGMSEMRRERFFKTTLLSSILWGITYPGLGYLGGESWQQAGTLSGRFGLLILLALAASLFHLWLKRKTD